MSDNYYEELGVEPDASRDEIRDAHRAKISDLEAAREKKGVSDKQLQQNREDVARVRAAWNVLSDPFQRQRYDARLAAPAPGTTGADGDGDAGDDDGDESASAAPGAELTGWRKFMAPPPKPVPAKNGTNGTNDKGGKAAPAQTNRRNRPEPTLVLPEGMTLAEPRKRGMALLFDLAVLLIIFYGVSLLVPNLIQSDYKKTADQITNLNSLHDAQNSIDDANKSINDAKTASDKSSAQKDLKNAQSDFAKAKKDANGNGVTSTPHNAKALQKQADAKTDHIRTTQYITALITLILAMLYLVPITAITGSSLGMRGRKIKVVRIDGSPVGWYASFARFVIPVLIALAIPSLGPLLGLGIVGWAYFDRNRQGIHDKLARTAVVDA